MVEFDLENAKNVLRDANLPMLPMGTTFDSQPMFDSTKAQAMVVGSDIISFGSNVEASFREAISNSALLAQLAVNQKISAEKDPLGWFDAYFNMLSDLGWTAQGRDTASYNFSGTGIEVHKAIIDVANLFLGKGTDALKLVIGTLTSLQSMAKDAPLITLFNKQSRHARVARFQLTTITNDPNQGYLVEIMAFVLNAKAEITQVLFFKVTRNKSSLKRSLAKLSLNVAALETLKPLVAAKIKSHVPKFIKEITLPSL